MCLNPIKKHFEGNYKTDCYAGKKGTPYKIDTYVKCGVCSQCIAEKANNWVVRNTYESKRHKEKCFITLTYAKNTYFLVKKDLQDFIKRLRRYLDYHNNGQKITMFSVGEYGTEKHRPHFHIIIYGWSTKKTKYLGLSKKGYPILQSKEIQKIWGLGRTTYQEFSEKEIPYIALYDTARETESFEYKMKRKYANKLLKELYEKEKKHIEELKNIKSNINTTEKYLNSIKNQIEQINNALNEMEVWKTKYMIVKEFNTWSKAVGWEEFYNEYKKNKDNYNFIEYIDDKQFVTPTSWVKKLANKYEEESAIKEMLRRRAELTAEESSEELKQKNINRESTKHIQEIFKYNTQKESQLDIESSLIL